MASYHNNMKFSTPDQDNDTGGQNCAKTVSGAWWYSNCLASSLNGLNYGPSESITTTYSSIYWDDFGGASISLKSVQMAIRPMN